jgi:ubiquinone/menaquinone biosynthesis C-methylase UbiE
VDERYSWCNPSFLFFHQTQVREMLTCLRQAGLIPIGNRHILEVGCGYGGWLPEFEKWGAQRSQLAGIDLDAQRVASARRLLGAQTTFDSHILTGADIRHGDAASLPWDDESFDIVIQSLVFTSIPEQDKRVKVAREMDRTLTAGGSILWFDFTFNNPRNPLVRKVTRADIRELFPNYSCTFRRAILAPPLARLLVHHSWTIAFLLERSRVLNTHLVGILKKPLVNTGRDPRLFLRT